MGDPWGFAEWGGLEGLSCSGATIANDYTCTALLSSRYVCAAKNAKKLSAEKKANKSLALPALHCGAVHKKQWEVVGGECTVPRPASCLPLLAFVVIFILVNVTTSAINTIKIKEGLRTAGSSFCEKKTPILAFHL